MIAVITDFKLRGISLHWKLLLSQVNKLIYPFLLQRNQNKLKLFTTAAVGN